MMSGIGLESLSGLVDLWLQHLPGRSSKHCNSAYCMTYKSIKDKSIKSKRDKGFLTWPQLNYRNYV